MMQRFMHHLATNPRKLFLIDSIGAFITAVSIRVLYHFFEEEIGMPKHVLVTLSFLAFCFCAFAAGCSLFLKKNFAAFIWTIALANTAYCVGTVVLLFLYRFQVSFIGTLYFSIEIAIVLCLVYIELQTGKTISKM